ncbi:hypothetical protein BD310DRAFT_257764 [Dichomitus squalens]|uniref:Uncharacterized protein n=1 Tax=Dichomitus squalens TaxID=114155 RepID=A0A4Q9PG47_9APHY|nr:hypothetical protein BD310DRAFT_257764 [Dichomitus squalens]
MTTESNTSEFRIALAHQTGLARQRQADVFLWSSSNLLGCYNSSTIGRIPVGTLLRWIKQSVPPLCPPYSTHQFAMAAVNLTPFDHTSMMVALRCRPILPPIGDPLHDEDPVGPGDYILFVKGEEDIFEVQFVDELHDCFRTLKDLAPFSKMSLKFEDKHHSEISSDLKKIGDGTGGLDTTPCTRIGWIYPPRLAIWHAAPRADKSKWTEESFTTPKNLIMMRDDVYSAFYKNAFGIDIDAQDKIYLFDSSSPLQTSLPRSPAVHVQDEETRWFLRQHFQHCLFVGIFGGDVEDDMDIKSNARDMLAEVRWRRGTQKFPSGDRWDSPLGKALKESITCRGSVTGQ